MPRVPCFQIDAFTNRPFAGNPAAVCVLDQPVEDSWMQLVAAEMNLAETAFVRAAGDHYQLRWFTPEVEVDLCGHATLATAHALWTEFAADPRATLSFQTRSGLLSCRQEQGQIVMDFPAVAVHACEPRPELLSALGCDAEWTGRTRFDDFVVVRDADIVRRLQPDFRQLLRASTRGVIVTAISDSPQADFVSRFFAPRVGIDEDPVTGSAHCSLGPFWSNRLGRSDLVGEQASRRGGVVGVLTRGERVDLRGQAVTVLRGELL